MWDATALSPRRPPEGTLPPPSDDRHPWRGAGPAAVEPGQPAPDRLDLMTGEVAKFAHWGGRSILEVTMEGFGRDVAGLREVSRRTGSTSSPAPASTSSSPTRPACGACRGRHRRRGGARPRGRRARDGGPRGLHRRDRDRHGLHRGEEKNLRGACRASARTQVPLTIHTPGDRPKSHDYRRRIVDIVEEEGADLRHTIIEHVYIRPNDLDAQIEIAARGAFLGYDGVSCDFNWGFRGSGPCDHELAVDVKRLIDAGFLRQILISHDVHLKIMLTAYGGTGYAHILRHFVRGCESTA